MNKAFLPYFLQSATQWIEDNKHIPLLSIKIDHACLLPKHFKIDEELNLNISQDASRNLHFDQKGIRFDTRFSGQIFHVFIPYTAVTSLHCKDMEVIWEMKEIPQEWWEGLSNEENTETTSNAVSIKNKKPALTLIRGGKED